MEISREFAEKEYNLKKSEADKWLKILKSFDAKPKSKTKLTKKEKDIMASNLIDQTFSRLNRKKRAD